MGSEDQRKAVVLELFQLNWRLPRLATVQVFSHPRQRQKVFSVRTFASVSTALPLQNGHMVGRVIPLFPGNPVIPVASSLELS